MTVPTAEKDHIKYSSQNELGKITFCVQTAAWLSCCCNKLRLFNFIESCKRLFHNWKNWTVLKWIMDDHYEQPQYQIEYII